MTIRHATDGNKLHPALLEGESPFRNRLLLAMPSLNADPFNRSVIYLCAHSPAGAMGIVLNQPLPEIKFQDLLDQLNLPKSDLKIDPVIHFGGPVEQGRGFVLHSTDFIRDETVRVNASLGMTGTIDILRAMALGKGPNRSIFALGYAGWGPGQLDEEMQRNAWLTAPPDDELIFDPDLSGKWEKVLLHMGVNPLALSALSGNA